MKGYIIYKITFLYQCISKHSSCLIMVEDSLENSVLQEKTVISDPAFLLLKKINCLDHATPKFFQ